MKENRKRNEKATQLIDFANKDELEVTELEIKNSYAEKFHRIEKCSLF